MTACPCDTPTESTLDIPAGLEALPRQLRAFPQVRRALLAELPSHPSLVDWRARGGNDLGLMWLEMWAYVADVLGFYDERIANESYLRTAQLRSSLRRLVELLGFVPSPGVASRVFVAGLAEGRKTIKLPAETGFRSDPTETQPPQVFELGVAGDAHPFKSSWQVGPVPIPVPATLAGNEFVFETDSFGLTTGQMVHFPDVGLGVAVYVTRVAAFASKDGVTRAKVTTDRPAPVTVADPTNVVVATPTVTASVARNEIDEEDPPGRFSSTSTETSITLNGIYRQLAPGQLIAKTEPNDTLVHVRRVVRFTEVKLTDSTLATRVVVTPGLAASNVNDVMLHFGFVPAGKLAVVGETEISPAILGRAGGVLLQGIPQPPPDSVAQPNGDRVLTQEFLVTDANENGAKVQGSITFKRNGQASFQTADAAAFQVNELRTPLTIYGNVLEVSQGESVLGEVLGSGDARSAQQQFRLRRKPLTYLSTPDGPKSTLAVRVDGVLWQEVKSFFGRGPGEPVFIVRHDDDQNTFITFGDGVRGARLPSGSDNVVAAYRFGTGGEAPVANSIQQLARPVQGLRSVRSPITGQAGRAPESTEDLRGASAQAALLFNRAVSVQDFQALAAQTVGVVQASAAFEWVESEGRAAVVARYIGSVAESSLLASLRDHAEENLPIVVQQATPRAVQLRLTLAVDPRFDAAQVAAAVRARLTDPDSGLLALKSAAIGGRFYASRVYEEAQAVAGVVAVTSAQLRRGHRSTNLASVPVLCASAEQYFDFSASTALSVSTVVAASNLLAPSSQGGSP